MIQKTYTFNSIEEMEEAAVNIRNNPAYSACGERVLLAFAQIWDTDDFARFRASIHRLFPDCTTVGCNHYSSLDILTDKIDGSGTEHGITLSFLFFRDSSADLIAIDPGIRQEERQGREMCSFLDTLTDVKGVYFVPPDYFCSSEAVMAAGLRGHKDGRDRGRFSVSLLCNIHIAIPLYSQLANPQFCAALYTGCMTDSSPEAKSFFDNPSLYIRYRTSSSLMYFHHQFFIQHIKAFSVTLSESC